MEVSAHGQNTRTAGVDTRCTLRPCPCTAPVAWHDVGGTGAPPSDCCRRQTTSIPHTQGEGTTARLLVHLTVLQCLPPHSMDYEGRVCATSDPLPWLREMASLPKATQANEEQCNAAVRVNGAVPSGCWLNKNSCRGTNHSGSQPTDDKWRQINAMKNTTIDTTRKSDTKLKPNGKSLSSTCTSNCGSSKLDYTSNISSSRCRSTKTTLRRGTMHNAI